jgi:FMN phosphatase YigB (HAD superfamily)
VAQVRAVVFDVGGVLLDWDPRHLYRSLLADEAELERFLAEVCTPAWNAELDAGRPDGLGRPAQETLFIDDAEVNVAGAGSLGFVTHRFVDAPTLERHLEELGLL